MHQNEIVILDPEREALAAHCLSYIAEHFPDAAARIPPGLPLFPGGFSRVDGCCSHPLEVRVSWLGRGEDFTVDTVPDGFFLVGVKNAGGSEYLLVMWRQGAHCFRFREQFVNYFVRNDAAETTRKELREALAEWDSGTENVSAGMWSERPRPARDR